MDAAGGGGATEGKDVLVERVKALQRASHGNKLCWWDFCRRHDTKFLDPRLHDAKSLSKFVEEIEFGSSSSVPPALSGHEDKEWLVKRVKELQRSSAAHKQAWYNFCQTMGSSDYDPMRHCKDNLRRFIEKMTTGKSGSSSGKAGRPDPSAPPIAGGSWANWWAVTEAAGGKNDGGASSSSSAAAWQGGKDPRQGNGLEPWEEQGGDPMEALLDGLGLQGSWDGWSGWPSWQGKGDWQAEDSWPADSWPQGMKGMMPGMMKGTMKGTTPSDDWMGKGGVGCLWKGASKGTALLGAAGKGHEALQLLPSSKVTLNSVSAAVVQSASSSAGKGSEFGILDAPPDALLAMKRGAITSMLPAQGTFGLMDEEQAKIFQQALKKRR